jgi:hypothetical protein
MDLRTQIQSLAATIAGQADAIANNRTSADFHAVAQLIKNNAETLAIWTGQLREQEENRK